MREKCPKTGKVIDKPDECEKCEFLMVTIPAGWMCTFSQDYCEWMMEVPK